MIMLFMYLASATNEFRDELFHLIGRYLDTLRTKDKNGDLSFPSGTREFLGEALRGFTLELVLRHDVETVETADAEQHALDWLTLELASGAGVIPKDA
jgi:hypothetical protein